MKNILKATLCIVVLAATLLTGCKKVEPLPNPIPTDAPVTVVIPNP